MPLNKFGGTTEEMILLSGSHEENGEVGRRGGSKLSAQWSKEGQSSEQASILRPCSAPS